MLASIFSRFGPVLGVAANLLVPWGTMAADNPSNRSSRTLPAQEWTVCGHVPLTNFVVQSHRGAGDLAPENTPEAFELGWKLGTVPEADLRTTKDGVIVAFHDANFKRVVKDAGPELQKKGVADVSFAELSKLDVGAWKGNAFAGRRVWPMTNVFALMRDHPERYLYLDIKNVDLKQLAAEVQAGDVSRQVILASTVHDVIREWKRLVPESQTLLWMGGTEPALKKRMADLHTAKFEGVTQLQVHIYANTNSPTAEPFTLSRSFLRSLGAELRQQNILYQALPWGATKPATYSELLDLGLASFATDHPEVTLQAVRDYYARAGQGRSPCRD